ncbi:hypothetical protein FHT77_003625 [Rhizobium sp. BK181]|nr:hypothetical protein [Rhizobium sp. BK181]
MFGSTVLLKMLFLKFILQQPNSARMFKAAVS